MLLAAMAAMAVSASDKHAGYRRSPAEYKPRGNTKRKGIYNVDYQEHEFIIHGEAIMARNRKTALKIYANRHKKK